MKQQTMVMVLGGEVIELLLPSTNTTGMNITLAQRIVDAMKAAGTREFMVEIVNEGNDVNDAYRVPFRYRQTVKKAVTVTMER